jgi:LPXTG-motif cell wall-anchored protein
MFRKLLFVSGLTFSLTCFGQVATTGGFATNGPLLTTPVNAANAPLISTPEVALPGSGAPVGAPIAAAQANDPRSSSGAMVANVPGPSPAGNQASAVSGPEANTATATVPGANNTEPLNLGIQTFVSGMPGASNSSQSLAEIATTARRLNRGTQVAKLYTNDTIAQLNAAGVQTGNLGAGNNNAAVAGARPTSQNNANAQNGTAADPQMLAQNTAPQLPQSDNANPSEQSSATAPQQKRSAASSAATSNPQANSAPAASDNAAQPDQNQNDANSGAQLPRTGTSLPLLLLLGAVGVGAGCVYLLRR